MPLLIANYDDRVVNIHVIDVEEASRLAVTHRSSEVENTMTELALVVSRTLWARLVSFIETVSAQYKEDRRIWAERARIVNELNASTDRELAELGFSRADLPAIANGSYQR